jgi:hypothetical protein
VVPLSRSSGDLPSVRNEGGCRMPASIIVPREGSRNDEIIRFFRPGGRDAVKCLRGDANGIHRSGHAGAEYIARKFPKRSSYVSAVRSAGRGRPSAGANLRGLGTAALTTALGAGLGGAIGGGRGAGIGAASGALGGAGLGTVGSANAQRSIQAQYDNAFAACMFSLGNTVPSMGPTMTQPQPTARPAPG